MPDSGDGFGDFPVSRGLLKNPMPRGKPKSISQSPSKPQMQNLNCASDTSDNNRVLPLVFVSTMH